MIKDFCVCDDTQKYYLLYNIVNDTIHNNNIPTSEVSNLGPVLIPIPPRQPTTFETNQLPINNPYEVIAVEIPVNAPSSQQSHDKPFLIKIE